MIISVEEITLHDLYLKLWPIFGGWMVYTEWAQFVTWYLFSSLFFELYVCCLKVSLETTSWIIYPCHTFLYLKWFPSIVACGTGGEPISLCVTLNPQRHDGVDCLWCRLLYFAMHFFAWNQHSHSEHSG